MLTFIFKICILSLTFLPLFSSAQSMADSTVTHQVHMITYQHMCSRHYRSWSIQYHEFEKESDEFVLPIAISFGNMHIDGSVLANKNIENVDNYALSLGFDGYEFIGDGLYFNLGIGVSPGIESIEKKNGDRNTRFLVGGNINTGVLFIPFPDLGLVIGLNLTGKLSNSNVLSSSLEFGIEAGITY